METLDNPGTPEPAGSDPTRESISTRAGTCESAFVKGLDLLNSNQGGRIYAIGLGKLQKRFTNWTGYLGVFAGGNGSLDQRLKRHPQHRDLVVVALNMLEDNLLQITSEPSDQDSDDSSDEGADRREIELEGIRMSINELDRLAIHIRQSSTSSLDARVKAFASKRTAEISSFETKAILAVNALYPDAHESLRQHLSKSMVQRHTKLLYWQSHDKKLRTDHRRLKHSQESQIERTPSPLPLKAVLQQQTAKSGSDTRPEPVARTGSVGISFLSDTFASDPVSRFSLLPKPIEPVKQRAGATTVLETGALFPKPPKFDDGDETAPCPLCRKVFQRHDFTNDVWRKSHVNEDLVPFVCVATSCLDSPNFTRRSEWRVHIEQDHSEFWQQSTATPLHGENKTHRPNSQGASENSPICSLCCSSPLEEPGQLRAKPQTSSESPEAPQPMSKEASDGTFGKKTVLFDVPEQEESLADQGSPTTPPATPGLETKRTKHRKMAHHIAGHLQFLALLTLRLSTKNLADAEDIDFASSQVPSGNSNSGKRSTLDDEFEREEGQKTQSIDMQESFSETNSVPVPEESIAPQDEDIPPTESMDWALFSPLDPPHGGEEDKVTKHITESLLKDAANRFAETDLPMEASEAAETLVRLLRRGGQSSGSIDLLLSRENLTREPLYQFFNASLSSVNDGVYATLANYCTEEVLEIRSHQDRDGAECSRRLLFVLLLMCKRPLDILRCIVEGLSDCNLPLSTITLITLFPSWDDQLLDAFSNSTIDVLEYSMGPSLPSPPGSSSMHVNNGLGDISSYASPVVEPAIPSTPDNGSLGPLLDDSLETPDQGIRARQNDIYGELNHLMQYPYATDLRVIKAQFEDDAGSLPRGVYAWIFDDACFRKFLADPQLQVLWIHGATRRGKTMLLCGIIDELRQTTDKVISYSFFAGTNSGIESATAVVRDLIHHLVAQRPSLLEQVRDSYELPGITLSDDLDSYQDLSRVLRVMLDHESMTDTVFIIDDVDENLFGLLAPSCLQFPSKWILSARSTMNMRSALDLWQQGGVAGIDLDLAQDQISQAISTYAGYRVESLVVRKHYGDSVRRNIYDYLVSNAGGSFLWVSMVCHELEDTLPQDIPKLLEVAITWPSITL